MASLERRLHNMEVAVRHLQEPRTTKIATCSADTSPLSPSNGWTFIAVNVNKGDPQKYIDRARRLFEFFKTVTVDITLDREWIRCSLLLYSTNSGPYVVPHPVELQRLGWDDELELRFMLQYSPVNQ